MSAQREMTLQELVDKLPGIHSAHKEFDSLQGTIAQQAERIAELERECNGLAARIGKELNVENEALKVIVSEQAALIEKCRGALDYTACGFTSVKAKNTSVSMAQEALAAIAAQKGGAA